VKNGEARFENPRITTCSKQLCAAVVFKAIRDTTLEPNTKDKTVGRRKAVLWLISRAATPWFDHLDLDQARVLMKSSWPQSARLLIQTDQLRDVELAALQAGVRYMERYNR